MLVPRTVCENSEKEKLKIFSMIEQSLEAFAKDFRKIILSRRNLSDKNLACIAGRISCACVLFQLAALPFTKVAKRGGEW